MIDPKLTYEIQIAMFILALFLLPDRTARAGTRQPSVDRGGCYEAPSGETFLAEGSAEHNPQQLAMNTDGQEDRRELQELLEVLDEETEVATKTKMNNDHVPGMVTVLHGDQVEALGMQTVADTLAMVPGIQVARLATGEPTVKVRGLAFPFNDGNVEAG